MNRNFDKEQAWWRPTPTGNKCDFCVNKDLSS